MVTILSVSKLEGRQDREREQLHHKIVDDFVHALDAPPMEATKNRLRFGRKAIHSTRTLLTVPQTAATRIMGCRDTPHHAWR